MATENLKQESVKEFEAKILLAKMARRNKLLSITRRGRTTPHWAIGNIYWTAFNVHWAAFCIPVVFLVGQLCSIGWRELVGGQFFYWYLCLIVLLYQNVQTNQRLDALLELLEEEKLLKVNVDKSQND